MGLLKPVLKQIYIKIDKFTIKPYLHHNYSIGKISLFVDSFHLQKQLDCSQGHILYLVLFYLSFNGI